jgi:hypothetical protein
MIPINSFAGKTVAVFGLGGSGLASCHALKAGGADVVASDDGVDRLAEAAQAGFVTADLRKVSWTNFAALVLTPGAPLTHPAPHWTVLAAQQAGIEVIGDIELFCRERRRHAPYAPFVAITGTNGKSTTTALIAHLMHVAGYDTQMGGNIGTAILSLEPPRMGRVHVARSQRRHPAQRQRRPHRSPRHAPTLRGGEGASGRRRAATGHRDRRRRRRMEPEHRRPDRAGRPARRSNLGEKSACRRHLCRA